MPLPSTPRFTDGIKQLLAQITAGRLVVFLDEIDALLPARFKDTFFSTLRNVFNEGSTNQPELDRVQFVLAGAARAEELISDRLRSPFNVGECIVLHELTRPETAWICEPMGKFLDASPERLAEAVYRYSAGSIYLTQLILEKLWIAMDQPPGGRSAPRRWQPELAAVVDEIVDTAASNVHFTNIAGFLPRPAVRSAYRIWLNDPGATTPDNRESLWFAGLSPHDEEKLYRNAIYERVFRVGGPVDLETGLRLIVSNLPRPQLFLGREVEVSVILGALDHGAPTWGAPLEGQRGIGKTALAIQVAHVCPPGLFRQIIFLPARDLELDDDGIRAPDRSLPPRFRTMLQEMARKLDLKATAKMPARTLGRRLLET